MAGRLLLQGDRRAGRPVGETAGVRRFRGADNRRRFHRRWPPRLRHDRILHARLLHRRRAGGRCLPQSRRTVVTRALYLYGGWPGHRPYEVAESAIAEMTGLGLKVDSISDPYRLEQDLTRYDLI